MIVPTSRGINKLTLDFTGGLSGVGDWMSARGQYNSGVGIDISGDLNDLVEFGQVGVGWNKATLSGDTVNGAADTIIYAEFTSPTSFLYAYVPSGTPSGQILRINTALDSVSDIKTITGGDIYGMGFYRDKIYYANTGNQIGSFTPSASPTFTDDDITSSTKMGARDYSPMHVFGDVLWIGNGNKVAQYDGSAFNDNALDLPTNFEITHLSDYNQYLVVVAQANLAGSTIPAFNPHIKVFFWDTVSQSWQFEYTIQNEKFITGLKTRAGTLYATGKQRLYAFNGNSFQTIVDRGHLVEIPNQVSPFDFWRSFVAVADSGNIKLVGQLDPTFPSTITTPFINENNLRSIFAQNDDKVYASTTSSIIVYKNSLASAAGVLNLEKRVTFTNRVRLLGARLRFDTLASGDDLSLRAIFDSESGTDSVSIGSVTFSSLGAVNQAWLEPPFKPELDNCTIRLQWAASSNVVLRPAGVLLYFEGLQEPNVMVK